MKKTFKDKTFRTSRWLNKHTIEVKNKNNMFYDYLQYNIEQGNFYPDETTVEYFNIYGFKYTLDDILDRYNTFYANFDVNCEEYPREINGLIPFGHNYIFLEVDSYGEKIRIWEEIK